MKRTIYFVIVHIVFVNNIVNLLKLRNTAPTDSKTLYHIEISKNVLKMTMATEK